MWLIPASGWWGLPSAGDGIATVTLQRMTGDQLGDEFGLGTHDWAFLTAPHGDPSAWRGREAPHEEAGVILLVDGQLLAKVILAKMASTGTRLAAPTVDARIRVDVEAAVAFVQAAVARVYAVDWVLSTPPLSLTSMQGSLITYVVAITYVIAWPVSWSVRACHQRFARTGGSTRLYPPVPEPTL